MRDHEDWVHKICQKYRVHLKYGNTYEDLFAVGMEGLAKAISVWDPAISKLTTFCFRPVTHAIWHWLRMERRRGFTATGDSCKEKQAPPNVVYGHDRPGDSDSKEVFDFLAEPERETSLQWTEEQWQKVLAVLPDGRFRRVIIGRYRENKTLAEVADELGVSRERIRQMEMNALARIGRFVKLDF